MKVTGIIAEYNPFHKGHQYQIDTLRKKYRPDYVVIAMSGDFLQRGAPAMINKYARARMALMGGADLVFELPASFAVSSAEGFADGGISLFATTGLVDSLCFGAESSELKPLTELAHLLAEEPHWYKEALLSYIKEGYSYPAARAKALPQYRALLNTPNNILAIEYLKSIYQKQLSIVPLLIPRSGGGYHDTDITAPNASASAIRKSLLFPAPSDAPTVCAPCDMPLQQEALIQALPDASYRILLDYHENAAFLKENDFSLLLHHALLQENRESLLRYADMTPALANRILQKRKSFQNWTDFCQSCHSKDLTYNRISRVLTHLLLRITDTSKASAIKPPTLPYLRVLGFRKEAAPLLAALKQHAHAPVITSLSSGEKQLTSAGLSMLHRDIYASDLYRSVLTDKCSCLFPNEYQKKLLTL